MSDDVRIYEMSPFDNVLYFPNNVDVRLCPKNGMSSIKELFRVHRKHDEYVGRSYRYDYVKREGDQLDLPFRPGSFRIAVRRDPVDRFKSACEYILQNRADHIANGRANDLPEISSQLDEVIDSIESGSVKNNHFYTQTWYMGRPDDYDMVVHILSVGDCRLELCCIGCQHDGSGRSANLLRHCSCALPAAIRLRLSCSIRTPRRR